MSVDTKARLDAVYAERNKTVALVARMATAMGMRAGVARHAGAEWEDDWRTVIYVDLPTGQVSWHFHDSERHMLHGLPEYEREWDGHDTDEKYRRVVAALAELAERRTELDRLTARVAVLRETLESVQGTLVARWGTRESSTRDAFEAALSDPDAAAKVFVERVRAEEALRWQRAIHAVLPEHHYYANSPGSIRLEQVANLPRELADEARAEALDDAMEAAADALREVRENEKRAVSKGSAAYEPMFRYCANVTAVDIALEALKSAATAPPAVEAPSEPKPATCATDTPWSVFGHEVPFGTGICRRCGTIAGSVAARQKCAGKRGGA